MLITKEFNFDAAHNLIHYHGKCERLHGHTYKLKIVLEGRPNDEGMIMDFCEISDIVKNNIISKLDHSYINDFIEQPSAENISIWIWHELDNKLRRENCCLYEIHLWETATSCVILRKSDFKE